MKLLPRLQELLRGGSKSSRDQETRVRRTRDARRRIAKEAGSRRLRVRLDRVRDGYRARVDQVWPDRVWWWLNSFRSLLQGLHKYCLLI